MHTFNSVLKLFETDENSMDFCEDFVHIQSILNYANEFIKPFKRIHHKGGNEPYINDVIFKLRKLLRSLNYLNDDNQPNSDHHTALRKITFFLILNTDVSWKYDLTSNALRHLTNTVPQLPKCLLLACIWELNLSTYFCECVANSPAWFPLPIIDGAVDSLKFANASEVLERIEKLVTAIYTLIARSDYRSGSNKIEHKLILSKYYDHTADFLRHFFTPDAEKFDKMSKFQYSTYKGYVLKHILHLILNCFRIYGKKPAFKIDPSLHIYTVMDDKEKPCDNHSANYSTPVDEALHKINVTLLDSLQYNVMQVELGTFADWVEEDIDDEQTLQFVVGTAVYEVMQLISTRDCFRHDVAKQLTNFAIKPKTVEQRAKEATLGEIMLKLDGTSLDAMVRCVWLNEFITRGDLVFDNDECMDTLKCNAEYLTADHCCRIIEYISSSLIDVEDNANIDQLKVMVNKSLRKSDLKEIQNICMLIVNLAIGDRLELNTFDTDLVELFNKTTSTFYAVSDLCVMAQNPKRFYDKMFEYGRQNEQQLAIFIDFVRAAPDISSKLLPHCLSDLFENRLGNLSTTEQNTIPALMNALYVSNAVDKNVVVTKFLYKILTASLADNCWTKVLIVLQSLLRISVRNDFGQLTAPVLVMVGQVLDQCRWDMVRYVDELETIVCKAIEFLQETSKRHLPVASDADKSWIQSKTAQFKPITRYYFQRYALTKDETPLHFDVYLRQHSAKPSQTKAEIVVFLCEIFVRCTKKETLWLAKNSQFLPYFGDVILVLSTVVSTTTISNSFLCFRHAFQCYINIVKDVIMPTVTSNVDAKLKLSEEIIQILVECSTIPIFNELFMNVHAVLLDIIENTNEIIQKIKPRLDNLKDCEAKQLFLQKIEFPQQ